MLLLSHVLFESVEPPPMSEPSMLAAAGQFSTCCPPSTSFGAFIDINPLLLNLTPQVLRPPPPYTPRHSHPTHNDLLKMHNTPMIVEPENEVDVVGVSDAEKAIEEEKNEEPLDLTLRRTTVCSPVPRPSVITATGRTIVRSASSVSSVYDGLDEHFERSLSGKWPRRTKTEEERSRASPMRRHTSFNSHASVPLEMRVKQGNCSDIDEHFRKALGGNFDQWIKKKDAVGTTVQRENLI